MDGYDLIGDIHGHALPLRKLLERLGYRERLGCYRHPSRLAIFLGDFIDRGPNQREALDIVRRMNEDGAAHAIMGNHEFNALAFHTADPERRGEHLRRRSARNTAQHQAFLDEFRPHPKDLRAVLDWFRQLPLWLDLNELRAVHAAWHPESMARLKRHLAPEKPLSDEFLIEATRNQSPTFTAVETLLKGFEAKLPQGVAFRDKAGHERSIARLKWWLNAHDETWRSICLVPAATKKKLPATPLPDDIDTGYGSDQPPVFIGHYWLRGTPSPITPNVACLDYSVAIPQGKLVAYRWDGEQRLRAENYTWVARQGA